MKGSKLKILPIQREGGWSESGGGTGGKVGVGGGGREMGEGGR